MRGTGDVVQRNGNGKLMYIGRNDQQRKRLGQRINLGAIANTMMEKCSSLLSSCKLILKEYEKTNAVDVILFVLKRDHCQTNTFVSTSIKNIIASHLNCYERPNVIEIIPLECWPTTVHEKTDKGKLMENYMKNTPILEMWTPAIMKARVLECLSMSLTCDLTNVEQG